MPTLLHCPSGIGFSAAVGSQLFAAIVPASRSITHYHVGEHIVFCYILPQVLLSIFSRWSLLFAAIVLASSSALNISPGESIVCCYSSCLKFWSHYLIEEPIVCSYSSCLKFCSLLKSDFFFDCMTPLSFTFLALKVFCFFL
jgi:hypothetical protein